MLRPTIPLLSEPKQYNSLLSGLQELPEEQLIIALRLLCQNDLYFLLRYPLNRRDVERQWLFERCREVQAAPNGYLDLWSREHYKSTIITFALTIQEILNDPEITVGIFSHTRPIAKTFLNQIKRELEQNDSLKQWFPDVLWADPRKQSPKWSEDDGIIVKRKTNPAVSTVEAWGLVDGQPTGKHYRLLVYDDVVTKESVTTPEMIAKTTEALELSYNLGADGGDRRFIGTRYHFNDSYRTIIMRGTATPRVRLATVDGMVDGEPVIWTPEKLAEKRRDMGPYTFSCQILQNPVADEAQGFKREWLQYWESLEPSHPKERGLINRYILVDPANEKKKKSDYTAAMVVQVDFNGNLLVVDMVRDRMNLTQRTKLLFDLHRRWKKGANLTVAYEQYGMQTDIQHIYLEQNNKNYRFPILELSGPMAKNDRIRRLIPAFEQGRMYLPPSLHRTDYQGKTYDLVQSFIEEEYCAFPVAIHDDMLDILSRVADTDLGARLPYLRAVQPAKPKPGTYDWLIEVTSKSRKAVSHYTME